MLDLSKLSVGLALPELRKHVLQADINLYAKASRDFNQIHIDEEFARKTPAGGTIAHGMLVLAYVSQMLTDAFGRTWLSGGGMSVRFKAPAKPGDILTIQAKIEKIQRETEQTTVTCAVLCANQNNEPVITGEAIVRLK